MRIPGLPLSERHARIIGAASAALALLSCALHVADAVVKKIAGRD